MGPELHSLGAPDGTSRESPTTGSVLALRILCVWRSPTGCGNVRQGGETPSPAKLEQSGNCFGNGPRQPRLVRFWSWSDLVQAGQAPSRKNTLSEVRWSRFILRWMFLVPSSRTIEPDTVVRAAITRGSAPLRIREVPSRGATSL